MSALFRKAAEALEGPRLPKTISEEWRRRLKKLAVLRADATHQESLRAATEASRKVLDANGDGTVTLEEVRVLVVVDLRLFW